MKKRIVRRIGSFVLAMSLILTTNGMSVAAAANNAKGELQKSIVEISSVKEFQNISENLDGNYELTANLDFSNEEYSVIGDNQSPFTGILNGNGYTISNVKIETGHSKDTVFAGLFGAMDNAKVSNLAVENCEIDSDTQNGIYAGVLAGKMNNSIVENVYADGEIISNEKTAYTIGGIAGAVFQNAETAENEMEFNISCSVGKVRIQTKEASKGEKGALAGYVAATALVQNSYSLTLSEKLFGTDIAENKFCAMLSDNSWSLENVYVGFDFDQIWKVTEGGARLKAQEYVENVTTQKEEKTSVETEKNAPQTPSTVVTEKPQIAEMPSDPMKHVSSNVIKSRKGSSGITVLSADGDMTFEDFTYTVLGQNATITQYNGEGGEVTIPEAVDGYPVTGIGDRAFGNCETITAVSLPNTITQVGSYAFSGCVGLKKVIMSDNSTAEYAARLESYVFSGCTGLTTVELSKNVTTIGDYAFSGCTALSSLTLPGNLKRMGLRMIENTTIKSITIPKNVTYGMYALINCKSLKKVIFEEGMTKISSYICASDDNTSSIEAVDIPDSVTVIQEYAFSGCGKLRSVSLPNAITKVGVHAFDGCENLGTVSMSGNSTAEYTTISRMAFAGCTSLTTVELSKKVTVIEGKVFSGCMALSSLELPENLIEMGGGMIENTAIKSITIPKKVTDCSGALENCESLQEVVFQKGMTRIPDGICANSNITEVDIPESVTRIGGESFLNCKKLSIDIIPKNVEEIGKSAFENCEKIESIRLPNAITDVGASSFSECTALKSVTMSYNSTKDYTATVERSAFEGCTSLKNVELSENVTSIKDYAFSNCTTMSSLTLPESLTSMGSEIIKNTAIRSITIPKNVTVGYNLSEYYGALANCESLTEVIFEDGRTSIPKSICSNSNINNVIIPDSVTSIEIKSFYYCQNLESIRLPESVKIIGDHAFANCKFASIRLPESVTEIEDNAFYGCENLKSVNLPNTITIVESRAFSGCTALETVTMNYNSTEGYEAKIGEYAFSGCVSLKYVEFSENVTKIGRYAFLGCTSLGRLTLPESLKTVGERMIKGTAISSITIPKNVSYVDAVGYGYEGHYKDGVFGGCTSLAEVIFEDGMTKIPSYIAASGNDTNYVTKVVIPASVTEMGVMSFRGCNNITIYGYKGSYAEEYATEKNIPFLSVAITKNMTAEQILAAINTSKLLNNISLGEETIDGPKVTVGEKTFTLFKIPASMNIELGDKIQAKVDTENNTVQMLIGLGDFSGSAKADSDTSWNVNYETVKSLYNGFEKKTKGKKNLNNVLNGKLQNCLKKFDASIAVDAKASVAGYIEFSYASGEFVFSNGGVILEAELGGEWEKYLACAPTVYVTFGLKAGFDGSLSLVRQETMNYTPRIDADFALDAFIGPGCGSKKFKTYAEVTMNGCIDTGIAYEPGDSLLDSLTLTLTGSMHADGEVFGHKVFDKEQDLGSIQIYPKTTSKSRAMRKAASLNDTINYSLEDADNSDRTNGNVDVLSSDASKTPNISYSESDVYKHCTPQLAYLNDGTMLLVWSDDDGSKTDANKTSLMYSVFDGVSWSSPEKIGETGGADNYPSISCDGEKVQIVWQKAEKAGADTTLPELLETVELYSVTYSDGDMGKVTRITSDNTSYEMMQSVAVKDEKMSVAWVENSVNDPFQTEGTNTIKLASYENGKWVESVVANDLSGVSSVSISYSGTELILVYETVNGDDSKIVLVQDGKTKEFTGTNAEVEAGILYYTDDTGLRAYDILTKGNDTIIQGTVGDVTVLDNGKDKAVVTTVYSGYDSELVYYSYDRTTGEWSDAVQLTDEKKYIRSYSVVMDKNGNITAAINFVTINKDESYGDAKLEVHRFADIEDVTVSETAYYDNDSLTAGGQLPLKFTVKNNGTKTIETLNVDLLDSKGNTLQTGSVQCMLAPGEEAVAAYTYTLPAIILDQTITIRAYSENEVKLSDNEATVHIGFADVSVEDVYLNGTSKNASIKGVVVNKGFKEASNVNVKVYAGSVSGTLIGTAELNGIDRLENKSFEIAIPEAYLDVNPLVEGNALYIVAETTSEEADYANNEKIYMIRSQTDRPLVLDCDSVTLEDGGEKELSLVYSSVVDPEKADVLWTSSDESVAVVKNGKVEAVGTGKTTITATVDGYTVPCEVTVSNDIAVTDITMSEAADKLLTGGTKQLTANILPVNATNKNITWNSSDESVATVNDNGEVKGIAVGTAEITAITEDGCKTAVSKVTVYQEEDAIYTVKFRGGSGASGNSPSICKGTAGSLITLPDNSYEKEGFRFMGWTDGTNTYEAGGSYRIPYADITLEAVWDDAVVTQYTISASAEVGGKITPAGETMVKEGDTQTYTITTEEDYTLSDVQVDGESVGAVAAYTFSNVNADHTIKALFNKKNAVKIQSIELDRKEITLTKKEMISLKTVIAPKDATDQQLKWSTSDINVASVVNGVVTAVGYGTAVITAEAQDGSGVKAACKVTVAKKQQSFDGTQNYRKIYGDPDFNLEITLAEGDGVIRYKSSDDNVASVSSSGKVIIKGAGSAVITASASETDDYAESVYDVSIEVSKADQTIKGTTCYNKKISDRTFGLDVELISGEADLQYSSADESVVKVSSEGLVTIVGEGETTLTVCTKETNNYNYSLLKIKIVITKDEDSNTMPTVIPSAVPTVSSSAMPTEQPESTGKQEPTKKPELEGGTGKAGSIQTDVPDATMAPSKQHKDFGGNVHIGMTIKDASGSVYKIMTKNAAAFVRPANKSVKRVDILERIIVDGTKFTVTLISPNAFKGCIKLKSVAIGKNVTVIGDKAFCNCTALSKVTIPNRVTKIGKQAFANCRKLKNITVKTTKLTENTVGKKAFKGIYKQAIIKVHKKQKKKYMKWLFAKGISKTAKVK